MFESEEKMQGVTFGPFGNPDANRSDTIEQYIYVGGSTLDFGDNRNLHQRIIVGRKGAGKTFYLRSLRRYVDDQSDEWIVQNEEEKLDASFVADLTSNARKDHLGLLGKGIWFDPRAQSREFWLKFWEKSILLAAFNLITSDSRFKKRSVNEKQFEYVERRLDQYPPSNSVITSMKSIAEIKSKNFSEISDYLDSSLWDVIVEVLDKTAPEVPPVAIIIDGLDENFDIAPDAWLDCQHGLFRAIFRLLNRSGPIGSRLHVIASIREIVFSSLVSSEHASRYLTDSHVAYITWDIDSAKEFFIQKLASIMDNGFVGAGSIKDKSQLTQWLGFDVVYNDVLGRYENTIDYIVRHTRLLPRDQVIMGNFICDSIDTCRREGTEFSELDLKKVVSSVSRRISYEILRSCSTEYVTSYDYLAQNLTTDDLDNLNRENQRKIIDIVDSIFRSLTADLIDIVKKMGNRYFKLEEFRKIISSSSFDIPSLENQRPMRFSIENIMFRQGLIEYQKYDAGEYKWIAAWRKDPYLDELTIPNDALLCKFHTSLADLIPEVSQRKEVWYERKEP